MLCSGRKVRVALCHGLGRMAEQFADGYERCPSRSQVRGEGTFEGVPHHGLDLCKLPAAEQGAPTLLTTGVVE